MYCNMHNYDVSYVCDEGKMLAIFIDLGELMTQRGEAIQSIVIHEDLKYSWSVHEYCCQHMVSSRFAKNTMNFF